MDRTRLHIMNCLQGIRTYLRPEELIALLFLLPFLLLAPFVGTTPWARHSTALCFSLPAVLIGASVLLTKRSPVRLWQIIRDFLPLVFAVWVYENMHALTGVLHFPDRHEWLIAADEWMFRGANPVVWMQRWVHPRLTDWMAIAYGTYYFLPPVLTMVLYRRGDRQAFRDVVLGIVLTFYIGFIGYVVVPATDPWITMRDRFSVDLQAAPLTQQALSLYTISKLKIARDCFPSLHTAVSLVVLVFGWRFWRLFFWVTLPCVFGLMMATVYLRLHYVVDLVAAVPVAMLAVTLAPRLNRWWYR